MNPEVEAVKRQIQIEGLASTYTTLKPSGHLLKGKCPFHEEKTPSFFVNLRTGRWRCFGRCATGWLDAIDFVGWLEYGDRWNAREPEMFKAAFGRLKDRRHVTATTPPHPKFLQPEYRPVPKSPDVMTLLDRISEMYQGDLWKIGGGPGTPLTYLRGRGFTDATIRTARLGYASADGLVRYIKRYGKGVVSLAYEMHLICSASQGDRAFFRRRILFPDLDAIGRTIHLCGRLWPDSGATEAPKYLSLKGFTKPLYGYAQLDLASNQPVFVVESPTDRLTLLQWGYDAVATLGTALAPHLNQCLAGLARPLLYLPHNDGGTGLKAATIWQASIGKGQIVPLPAQVKDINDLGCWSNGQAMFRALVTQFPLSH